MEMENWRAGIKLCSVFYIFCSKHWRRICCTSEVAQSCPTLVTSWTAARQAPLSMGFTGQEYWSGLPSSSPGDLPNPGMEPVSRASPPLVLNHLGSPVCTWHHDRRSCCGGADDPWLCISVDPRELRGNFLQPFCQGHLYACIFSYASFCGWFCPWLSFPILSLSFCLFTMM